MIRSKKVKAMLLTAGFTLGMSAIVTVSSFAHSAGLTDYITVGGDSLYKISRVFNTTVDNLMNVNSLDTYSLDIGQTLKVPGETYTVKKGDTLYLISKEYRMPLSSLSRANNIYNDRLDIGQRLAVPNRVSQPSVTPAPAPAEKPAAPAPAPAEKPAAPAPEKSSAVSPGELDLLARLIMAEAQGEPYEAKVAIGAVVLNRVESGLFASTINDVINQNINGYYQFTPVENGWINNPANADSIKAAKEGLSGIDPTNGALWYYDDSTTNKFMLAKKVSIKIGHMVFSF